MFLLWFGLLLRVNSLPAETELSSEKFEPGPDNVGNGESVSGGKSALSLHADSLLDRNLLNDLPIGKAEFPLSIFDSKVVEKATIIQKCYETFKNLRQSVLDYGKVKCVCCCDLDHPGKMTHCDVDDSHFVCKPCTTQVIQDTNGGCLTRMKCALRGHECEGIYSEYEIRKVLDEEAFIEWSKEYQHNEIASFETSTEKWPFCHLEFER